MIIQERLQEMICPFDGRSCSCLWPCPLPKKEGAMDMQFGATIIEAVGEAFVLAAFIATVWLWAAVSGGMI